MKAILALVAILLLGTIFVLGPTRSGFTIYDCASAVLFCTAVAVIAGFLIRRDRNNGSYLLTLFLFALFLRIAVATLIFVFNGEEFFGGDAVAYDSFGNYQMLYWQGNKYAGSLVNAFIGDTFGGGWGMLYLVGGIYTILGRNPLAIQYFNAVLGAATAPLVFWCAHEVFKNRRVAATAALAVAFYPSLVLWSSQGLKDGSIVFFLALSILATLKLGQKFSALYLAMLVISLFGVLAFRFYIFYMLAAAIGGAFMIGMREITARSLIRQFLVIVLLGLSLTYMGVTRYAATQYETYGSLEAVQRSRLDAAVSAQSGFQKDVDVSTARGALSTIPIGIVYLLFAPFPWQLGSLRQSLTLPEMIIWWAVFPLLILGIWFSIRHRLRQMAPILIFTSMLTLAYSLFQGNVGTAYRQRGQLLVFYFIFVAVGAVLLKEKREEKRQKAAEALRVASVHLKPALVSRGRAQRI